MDFFSRRDAFIVALPESVKADLKDAWVKFDPMFLELMPKIMFSDLIGLLDMRVSQEQMEEIRITPVDGMDVIAYKDLVVRGGQSRMLNLLCSKRRVPPHPRMPRLLIKV